MKNPDTDLVPKLASIINGCIDSGEVRSRVFVMLERLLLENKSFLETNEDFKLLFDGVTAFNKGESKDYRKAKEKFDRFYKYPELEPFCIYFASTCLFFLERYAEGIEFLKSQLEKMPQRADLAYEGLGYFQLQEKQFQNALESFENSIILNHKRTPLCLWGKGRVYEELQDFEAAIRAFQLSKHGESNCYVRSSTNIAEIYCQLGQINNAYLEIDNSLKLSFLHPEDLIELRYEKAKLHMENDRIAESVSLLKELLIQPILNEDLLKNIRHTLIENLISENQLADAEVELKKYGGALKPYLKVKYQILKSRLSIANEDFKSAEKCLNNALEIAQSKDLARVISWRKINLYRIQKEWTNTYKLLEELRKQSITPVEIEKIHLERGLTQFLEGKIEDATESLKKATNSTESELAYKARLKLIEIYLGKNEYENAKIFLIDCERLKIDARSKSRLLFLHSIIEFNLKNFDSAFLLTQQSKDKYPVDKHLVKCIEQESQIYAIKRDFEKAHAVLDVAIGSFSSTAHKVSLVREKANIYLMQTKFEKAISCLNDVISTDLDPQIKAEMLFTIGDIHFRQAAYENAQSSFERASKISSDPDLIASCFFHQGICFSEMKRHKEALECYQEALKGSELLISSFFLAFSMIELEKNIEEKSKFDEILETSPESDKTLVYLAKAVFLEHHEQWDESIQVLSLCKVDPENSFFCYWNYLRAKCYLKSQKFDLALNFAKEAESALYRSNGGRTIHEKNIYSLLSQIFLKLNDLYLAREYAEKAIENGSRRATRIFEIDKNISEHLRKQVSLHQPSTIDFGELEKTSKIRSDRRREMITSAENSSRRSDDHTLIGLHPEIEELFRGLPEHSCHYTSAETALFYILPSAYNHNELSNEFAEIRLNSLGSVNDIEEGEFRLKNDVETTNNFARKQFDQLRERIKEEVKIFCLSWINTPYTKMTHSTAPFLIPPMWSRYGHRHSGVCIIFDVYELTNAIENYCKKNDIGVYKFQRVIYTYPQLQNDVNEKISATDLQAYQDSFDLKVFFKKNDGKLDESRLNCFFFKPPHWDYESEYRIVIHQRIPGPVNVQIPIKCIKGVVMGKEVKQGHKKMLIDVCRDKNWFLLQYDPTAEEKNAILQTISIN